MKYAPTDAKLHHNSHFKSYIQVSNFGMSDTILDIWNITLRLYYFSLTEIILFQSANHFGQTHNHVWNSKCQLYAGPASSLLRYIALYKLVYGSHPITDDVLNFLSESLVYPDPYSQGPQVKILYMFSPIPYPLCSYNLSPCLSSSSHCIRPHQRSSFVEQNLRHF